MKSKKTELFRLLLTAKKYILASGKWVVISLILGFVGGFVGALFYKAVAYANELRTEHWYLILFLPLAGVAIAGLYSLGKIKEDPGTNLIISSVRSNKHIPFVMAPLIFVSTVLTHLFGGSAGREGAALQLGGSLGAKLGELLKLNSRDMSIVIMCGMSAVFSALFETPLTAVFFAMGVISVGVIYYAGLVPCIISSLVAYKVSFLFGNKPETFNIDKYIPKLSIVSVLQVSALALVCAWIAILFCVVMRFSHYKFKTLLENQYVRVLVGSAAIVLLTVIVGNQDYNGAGTAVIQKAIIDGSTHWYSFALKILFTAITIGCGLKGGEIVPTMFIGATFGCTFAPLLGLSPQFGAAVGLITLFCGAVNCPIAAIVLSIEMFGTGGLLLFALAGGISYVFSGYYGLYSSQKIVYSKLTSKYINKNAK